MSAARHHDSYLEWHLADRQLMVRRWNDEAECVVFSPLSGEVHLLNLEGLALLDTLAGNAMSAREVAERLVAPSGRPLTDDWSAALGDALTTLDRAGLIEPRRRDTP